MKKIWGNVGVSGLDINNDNNLKKCKNIIQNSKLKEDPLS